MRKGRSRLVEVGLLVVGFSFVALPSANAYIDPGSGSFIFQMIVAGALGAGLALKIFWRKIVDLFRALFSRKRDQKHVGSGADAR